MTNKRQPNYILFLLLSFYFTLLSNSQSIRTGDVYYKIFDNYIGIENKELNNGRSYIQQYRTVNKTHVFYKTPLFTEGYITYRKQVFFTPLKYDLYNDVVVVKYIDSNNAFSLSLNTELITRFEIGSTSFIKLPKTESLSSIYGNGFFEKAYQGEVFDFYIKYKKEVLTNKEQDKLFYKFIDAEVYVFSYKEHFYEINKLNDLIKVVPHLKEKITINFGNIKRINRESLLLLFRQIDNE